MRLKEIGWNDVVSVLRRKPPVVAAGLCTAQADGSDPRYAAGERRELLVMVRADDQDSESAIQGWLKSNGWCHAVILEHRMLEETFDSADSQVRACYVNAMTSDGGCVVYAEPV